MGYNMTAVTCPVCGSMAEYDSETDTVYCQPCIGRRHQREAEQRRRDSTHLRSFESPPRRQVKRFIRHPNDNRPFFYLNQSQLDELQRPFHHDESCGCDDCRPKSLGEILGIKPGQQITWR